MRLAALALALLGLLAACEKATFSVTIDEVVDLAPTVSDRMDKFARESLPLVQREVPGQGVGLSFRTQYIEEHDIIAAVPKGWRSGIIAGTFRPRKPTDYGFMTRFMVGVECGGECAPKDWSAVTDHRIFSQFGDGTRFEVVSSEVLTEPDGRLLVARSRDGSEHFVAAARWRGDLDRYLYCQARLQGGSAGFGNAFARACETALLLPLLGDG